MVVGCVTKVALARDGSEVVIDVNVDQEYAHLVRANSRFWNVSGVKADIGLTGGTIEVETVQSLLAGGIAFNTPEREMGRPSRRGIAIRSMAKPRKSVWSGVRVSSPDLFPLYFIQARPRAGLFYIPVLVDRVQIQNILSLVVGYRPSFRSTRRHSARQHLPSRLLFTPYCGHHAGPSLGWMTLWPVVDVRFAAAFGSIP